MRICRTYSDLCLCNFIYDKLNSIEVIVKVYVILDHPSYLRIIYCTLLGLFTVLFFLPFVFAFYFSIVSLFMLFVLFSKYNFMHGK